jgi:Cu2+-containing amine oxidase
MWSSPFTPDLPCLRLPYADTPVLRHFSYANDFFGAQKGWTLTIRVISQVYNYDYIMDTILHVDGTFETRVVTSG